MPLAAPDLFECMPVSPGDYNPPSEGTPNRANLHPYSSQEAARCWGAGPVIAPAFLFASEESDPCGAALLRAPILDLAVLLPRECQT
jgi:hypothetical protein